jgi:hypothetical protein
MQRGRWNTAEMRFLFHERVVLCAVEIEAVANVKGWTKENEIGIS